MLLQFIEVCCICLYAALFRAFFSLSQALCCRFVSVFGIIVLSYTSNELAGYVFKYETGDLCLYQLGSEDEKLGPLATVGMLTSDDWGVETSDTASFRRRFGLG